MLNKMSAYFMYRGINVDKKNYRVVRKKADINQEISLQSNDYYVIVGSGEVKHALPEDAHISFSACVHNSSMRSVLISDSNITASYPNWRAYLKLPDLSPRPYDLQIVLTVTFSDAQGFAFTQAVQSLRRVSSPPRTLTMPTTLNKLVIHTEESTISLPIKHSRRHGHSLTFYTDDHPLLHGEHVAYLEYLGISAMQKTFFPIEKIMEWVSTSFAFTNMPYLSSYDVSSCDGSSFDLSSFDLSSCDGSLAPLPLTTSQPCLYKAIPPGRCLVDSAIIPPLSSTFAVTPSPTEGYKMGDKAIIIDYDEWPVGPLYSQKLPPADDGDHFVFKPARDKPANYFSAFKRLKASAPPPK